MALAESDTGPVSLLERYETRERWLAARRTGIGGTDAQAILGHHPYRSAYTVWGEKKLGLEDRPLDVENEAMLWGRILESPVREEWQRREGMVAEPTPYAILRDAQRPFLIASPDALVGHDAGLEIKTASEWKAIDWKSDIPLGYQIQMQHYLSVSGRERWHVAALIGGQKLVTATINRNEPFIKTLREALIEWWEQHVIGDARPAVDGSESTSETIKRLYPPESVTGEVVQLDPEYVGVHQALIELKKEEKRIGKRIAEIENRIKATIGSAAVAVLPNGLGRYTFKPQHRDEYPVKAGDFRVLRYSKKGE